MINLIYKTSIIAIATMFAWGVIHRETPANVSPYGWPGMAPLESPASTSAQAARGPIFPNTERNPDESKTVVGGGVPASAGQVEGALRGSDTRGSTGDKAAPGARAQQRTRQACTYTVRMRCSAYCPCKVCCGPKACGITASGKPVSANGGKFVAADRSIPFGTRVEIPGYADGQPVPVIDRGGAIKGNRLDLYFPTHQQARNWGVRYIDVIVYQ